MKDKWTRIGKPLFNGMATGATLVVGVMLLCGYAEGLPVYLSFMAAAVGIALIGIAVLP